MTIVRRAHRGAQTPTPTQSPQEAAKVAPRSAGSSVKPHSCGCGAHWSGMRTCHCSSGGCHQTFGGLELFDNHRRLGGCLPPEQVKGVERLVDGVWRGPEWSPDKNTFGGVK